MTEKKEEFEQLVNEYHNIIYSDRMYVPKMKAVKDMQKLHLVALVREKLPANPLMEKRRNCKNALLLLDMPVSR